MTVTHSQGVWTVTLGAGAPYPIVRLKRRFPGDVRFGVVVVNMLGGRIREMLS